MITQEATDDIPSQSVRHKGMGTQDSQLHRRLLARLPLLLRQVYTSLRDIACEVQAVLAMPGVHKAISHPFKHAGALPRVIEGVRSAGGYVSDLADHDAAVDLLQRLAADLALLSPRLAMTGGL